MNGTLIRGCALASAGVLATLALSGCGGGDTTSADPTPSFSSASSSLSPSPESTSASPVEDSTSAAVGESPEEFVRRWNNLSTSMQNTGDTKIYRSISQGCTACQDTADLVDKYYEAGGYVHTDGWTIREVSCKATGADKAECVAKISNPLTRYRVSASSPEMTFPSGPFEEFFKVEASRSTWNMAYIAQEAS